MIPSMQGVRYLGAAVTGSKRESDKPPYAKLGLPSWRSLRQRFKPAMIVASADGLAAPIVMKRKP